MRTTWLLMACALVFSTSLAQGAEYFIYQDPSGKVVLSNITPPPRAAVIKREELQDVTDEELRAAREREHAFWQRLKDEELAESNRKLAESNDRLAQAIITAAALRDSEPDLVQVAVANASPFDRFRSRRPQQRGRLNSGFRPHARIR
jgi:DNA-binding IclR family transcriptional regulator